MKPRTLAALTLTLIATTACAADGTFDRNFSVGATPSVTISAGSGYIHVTPGSDSQIHVIGHVHIHAGWIGTGSDEDRVKEIVAKPPITQTGDIVTIGEHGDYDLFRNVSIDYDVTLPKSAILRAHDGSGDVKISGIEKLVEAKSGSGSVHVENAGANVHLSAGSGSVEAVNLGSNAEIHTGSGEIRVRGLTGGLRATSGSGSVEVAGNPTSDWTVQTGSGSIRLAPDSSAHFTFSAATGSGSVKLDRPIVMQGSLERHHVSGTVNGGGPTIHVTTGSGSVTVH